MTWHDMPRHDPTWTSHAYIYMYVVGSIFYSDGWSTTMPLPLKSPFVGRDGKLMSLT